MNTTITTAVLQDLVAKAVKGSSMVDKLPLTCLMQIKVKDNKLTVSTTDNTNHLTVFANVQANDFEAVVDSKLFSALVSKLSTDNTTLSIEENKLIVEANGKYNIALPVDSDGSSIKFTEPYIIENKEGTLVGTEAIKSILSLNKSCKAEMKELPALFNYYMDNEKVLTTDFYKACSNPIKVVEEAVCLPPNLMELVPYICDNDGVKVVTDENNIMFYSSTGRLCGKKCIKEELEAFPVADLMESLNDGIPYACKINRTLLINAIDRICLFVDTYNSNKITLIFNNKQVTLHSDSTNSNESLIYLAELAPETPEFKIDVDALFLKNQLNACNQEQLTIKFGNEAAIQIQCDKVALLLSVLGEDE